MTTKSVQGPASDSYQAALIDDLKDPGYAAAYLETHLESDEFEADPALLHLALSNVAMGLGGLHMSSDKLDAHMSELHHILQQPGASAIYGLSAWLDQLGLKLTVQVKTPETTVEKQGSNSEQIS